MLYFTENICNILSYNCTIFKRIISENNFKYLATKFSLITVMFSTDKAYAMNNIYAIKVIHTAIIKGTHNSYISKFHINLKIKTCIKFQSDIFIFKNPQTCNNLLFTLKAIQVMLLLANKKVSK